MQSHFKGRLTVWLSSFFAFTLLMVGSVGAQSGHDLTGSVKDDSGAAVAQATVSLLSARQTAVASARTDAQGQFKLSAVPAGTYELLISGKGFDQRRRAVSLPRDASAPIEIKLGLPALTAKRRQDMIARLPIT